MATLITKNSSTASAVPAAGDLVKGELAVNVTDKKVYTKDNSAAVVKLVGSLGNQEANAVAVTGGTINGTTIGATTPSTGAFTTASASSGFTGNLTGNVTGNVSGTAANVTGVVAIANGGTGLSALGTGVQTALGQAVTGSGSFVLSTSPSLTTPNLGTPSAAVLTNATGLPLTTGVTGTLGVANGGTGITAFGTGVATALGQNVTGSGGIVLATSPSLTTPNLGTPSAATLTNATGLPIATGVSGLGTGVATALGVATGSAGAFVVNGGALGTPSSGTLTNATGLPISTGVSGLGTGVATALAVNTGSAGAFVVNGGALGTPSSGTVTNLTGTASININGTVGATTPSTGAFTTLSASSTVSGTGFSTYLASPPAIGGTTAAAGSFTTLTTSSTVTINGGTANGVAYLNGSKVLTTGSALTFDGTNLTVPAEVYRTSDTSYLRLSGGNGPGTGANVLAFGTTHATAPGRLSLTATGTGQIQSYSAGGDHVWSIVSEQMRLTSTGLGIGTSSPGRKLAVSNAGAQGFEFGPGVASGGGNEVLNYNRSTNLYVPVTHYASTHAFYSGTAGGTLGMYQDSSGNLGLGVTPSAWGSAFRALEGANGGYLAFQTSATALYTGLNHFFNGTNFIYKTTNFASQYQQYNGQHFWLTAPSGTAGNAISFTQAMTLDASGRLGIKQTSPTVDLDVGANDNTVATLSVRYSTVPAYLSNSFDGSVGLTTLSANSFNNSNGSASWSSFENTGYGCSAIQIAVATTGADIRFLTAAAANTNPTERARITSGGYFKASDSGSYIDPAIFHEFTQTANSEGLQVRATNASYSNTAFQVRASRNTTNNSFYYISCYNDGVANYRMRVADSGDLTNVNGTYGTISDAKMKTDIVDAGSQWADIKAIRFRKYKMINDPDQRVQLGVVAQELEQVSPGLVDEHADRDAEGNDLGTTTKSVKTSVLLMKSAVALQEAMKRIEELEARLAAAGI